MGDGPLVLVVEDDAANRLLAMRVLAARGYRVVEATDGRQALARIDELRPAIVVMDLSMPGLDGWETTRRVRRDPELGAIKIVAVSAHAMSGDRERALAAGCDDYLSKPYRPAELAAVVDRLRMAIKPAVTDADEDVSAP